jgi:uncharacterized protein YndB with AHSA1/START domain
MSDSPKADSNSVITECDLPDAPEKVWQALTAPELLAAWLPEAVDCEILAAEPHRLLRYSWPAGEHDKDAVGRKLDSVVTFELDGTSTGGTHLRVVHRVLTDAVASASVAPSANTMLASTTSSASVIPFARRSRAAHVPPRRVRKDPVALAGIYTLLRRAA